MPQLPDAGAVRVGWIRASQWTRSLSAALAVVSIFALWPCASAMASPCEAASALARNGRTQDAQAAYLQLFKSKPIPACARAGLRRLAKREFSIAGALIHAGYRAGALKEIALARAATPTAPVPVELRRFIGAQRTFARVRALDKAGFHEAATDLLRRFLKKRPTPAGGVPADMNPLLQGHSWLHRVRAWVERETDSWKALLTLLWLLLVGVGIYLVGRELARRIWRLRRPRLSISTFSGCETGGSAVAEGFALELQEAVHNIGVEMGGKRPDMTLPPKPSPEELPDSITTAFPQMKYVDAVVALIDRLIPTRDRSLTGYLQAATSAGVGASFALAGDDGRIRQQVTLRQGEFGPVPGNATADAGAYATLLPPATYWLLAADGPSATQGGTGWRPRALFAAGARLQEAGNPSQARRLYADALSYQPPIPGVLLNLSSIEIKEGVARNDIGEIGRGIAHLRKALELLQ